MNNGFLYRALALAFVLLTACGGLEDINPANNPNVTRAESISFIATGGILVPGYVFKLTGSNFVKAAKLRIGVRVLTKGATYSSTQFSTPSDSVLYFIVPTGLAATDRISLIDADNNGYPVLVFHKPLTLEGTWELVNLSLNGTVNGARDTVTAASALVVNDCDGAGRAAYFSMGPRAAGTIAAISPLQACCANTARSYAFSSDGNLEYEANLQGPNTTLGLYFAFSVPELKVNTYNNTYFLDSDGNICLSTSFVGTVNSSPATCAPSGFSYPHPRYIFRKK